MIQAFYRLFKIYLPILIVVLATYIFVHFVIQISIIPTESMYPTYPKGTVVIGNRISDVHRGDVIIFDKKGLYLIKRIIGEGGDILEIKNGCYYINGKKETFKAYGTTENDIKKYKVPDNCYFVSGDNRKNSFDSRKWNDPFVKKKDVVSKVIISFRKEGKHK